MHASTWCLWRVRHHCMFFFHAIETSEKSYPQKWWKQAVYDDLWLFTMNNELFLCYLCFAEVTLAWAFVTGTWLKLLFVVWQECASVPEIFKQDWFAGSPERVCVHGTALHGSVTSVLIISSGKVGSALIPAKLHAANIKLILLQESIKLLLTDL